MPRNLPPGSPKPPGHLGTAGRRLWRSLQSEYRITDQGGLVLLGQAAEALDRLRGAQQLIAERGALLPDRYGGLRANPATAIERAARSALLQALRQLHLDVEPLKAIGRPGGS